MKAMFILIAIVLAIGAAIYYFGVSDFDPDAQGAAARAAITPGMTWQQVIDTTTAPKKYRKYAKKTEDGIEYTELGPENRFAHAWFTKNAAEGYFSDGFVFDYFYSAKTAFRVEFDDTGKVIGTNDIATMADLLQTR